MTSQWTVILLVATVSILANPAMGRLSVQITQAIAKEGANVTVVCRLQDPEDNVIMYIAKAIPLQASPQELITTNEELTPFYESLRRFKVTMVRLTDAALLTLYIYGVKTDDTGEYKCLVPSLDNLLRATTLEVYKAPISVRFTNHSDTLLVSENESRVIECAIAGVTPVPLTSITMWKNQVHRNRTAGFSTSRYRNVHCDGPISSKNCSLYFDYDVQLRNYNFTFSFLDDGALLTCQPEIPKPDFDKARAQIKVAVTHIPKFRCERVVQYPLHAYDAELRCTAFSNPIATYVEWGFTLAGKQYRVFPGDSQSEYEAKQRAVEGSNYEMILVIRQVSAAHFTNYTLSVTNDLGTNTTVISLREEYNERNVIISTRRSQKGIHSGKAPFTSQVLLHLLSITLIILISKPLLH